ncbi:MAG: fibronectin type III domain-containing protein, partial [Akkermansiaceae bacterium]|nr:fibronectin type III domain-containing protein [Akkermansiaceae bacterium]
MNRKTLPNLEIASRCRKGLVVLFFIPLGALSPAAELKGLWEFADAANLAKATFGNDLILGGAHTHHATLSDDAATPLSGAITTAGGTTSFLKALHGIAPNGGGTFVNQYSIMVDLFSPAGSRGNYRAIFQTAATPTTNDADYFINPTGDTLGTSAWGYSSSGINETKWTRLVITVDLTQAGGASTPKYRTYLDGSLFHAHTGTADGALNGRFSLFPVGHASHGIHFFADNTAAENPPMNIGTLAIYDGVLTPAEVAALGGAGNPVPTPDPGEPPSLAAGPAGPASVTTGFYNNFSFAATDPEGAQVQVQVDWGDGTLSAWSALAGSGTPIALAKTYHLAGTHELRARARDQLGGTSAWVAIQTVTATTPPGVPDGLAGLWEFDDPGNPGLATFGNNLTVVGATPAHAATLTDGAASPATLQGVITTVQGAANRLLANHGLGGNGGGSKTNQYTLLFDVLLPAAGQWRSFYQTNPANSTDAQFFVRNSDSTLGRVAITYSRTPLEPNRWARLAISVRLGSGGQFTSYLDGMPFHSHTVPATDGEFALDPAQLLLFADNDGENHPLAIGMAALFAKALTESEIGALGGPGLAVITDPSNQPPAIVQQSAGSSAVTTGTTENYVFTATDPDGDPVQVQADWGDGTVSSWTGLGPAGIAQSRAHSWSAPGTFLLRARARDSQGGVSSWVELQSVQVTGPAVVTFLTPPYLQNMATDRMVVMWETAENIQLDLQHGLPGGGGARVIGERVASGGGTYFHRAVITGLQPGASYSYQVLSGNDPVTQPATFRTAPAGSVDFKFGALGD